MLRDDLDYAMKNEVKIRKAIKEKKLDRCNPSGGGHAGIPRPTEMLAIKELQSVGTVLVDGFVVVEEPERTILVIERTKEHFSLLPQGRVYREHYMLHEEDYKIICEKLKISTSTYYNYINQILDYAEKEWYRNNGIY